MPASSIAALGSGGDRVAAALRNGDIHVWRQPGGEELSQFDGGSELRALRFGADDATLVMADSEGVSITDLSGKRRWRRDGDGALWAVALDGDWAAAGSTDGRVWLWSLSTAGWEAKLRLSSARITALDVDAQRHRIAAADEKGWRWDAPPDPR